MFCKKLWLFERLSYFSQFLDYTVILGLDETVILYFLYIPCGAGLPGWMWPSIKYASALCLLPFNGYDWTDLVEIWQEISEQQVWADRVLKIAENKKRASIIAWRNKSITWALIVQTLIYLIDWWKLFNFSVNIFLGNLEYQTQTGNLILVSKNQLNQT